MSDADKPALSPWERVEADAARAPSDLTHAERAWLDTAVEAFCDEQSHEQVVRRIATGGASQSAAERIAVQARDIKRKAFREQALKTIGEGALWAGGGAAVTAATFMLSDGGGFYIVTWGPIGWGLWTIGRGVTHWLKA
jgi:hypothetical protein